MKFFREKKTPVENIAFISLVAAFDALICLVGALLPFSAIFVMIVAPLTSALVAVYCKKRYLFIYLFAAMGICIAVTAWDFMTTLFYMIPGLITGAVYGFLWRIRLPMMLNLFFCTLVSLVFFLLSLLLIKGLLGADMVQVFLALIGRKGDVVAETIFPLFAFGYSLAQVAIMHAFLSAEIHRLENEERGEGRLILFYPLFAFLFLGTSLILAFFHAKTGYFLLGVGIYWAFASVSLYLPKPHPLAAVYLIATVFASILIFAASYARVPSPGGLLLIAVPFALIAIGGELNFLLLRHQVKKSPTNADREL